MAKAISTSPTRKLIVKTQRLGKRWAKTFEDDLMKAGAKFARAELKAGRQTTADRVVVKISASFFLSFPRSGKSIAGDAGTVDCNCKETQPGVCVCTGHCPPEADCPLVVA